MKLQDSKVRVSSRIIDVASRSNITSVTKISLDHGRIRTYKSANRATRPSRFQYFELMSSSVDTTFDHLAKGSRLGSHHGEAQFYRVVYCGDAAATRCHDPVRTLSLFSLNCIGLGFF